MIWRLLRLLVCGLMCPLLDAAGVVNVSLWGGEIPQVLINQFTKTTGIKVNVSTYESNESLFAKLMAQHQSQYDVILPSAYFVERMQRHNMLSALDHTLLPNLNNLSPQFKTQAYDPGNRYSVPLVWGATGIVYNRTYIKSPPTRWRDLWSSRFHHQLMLLDDSRDVFAMALLSLHFPPNDQNLHHIQRAFNYLIALKNNIKLFASESIQAMLIDEDILIGVAWNGDAYKAQQENAAIQFIYPRDGFIVWIDCLAIPNHPPHPIEAHAFINFLLEARSAARIATVSGHAITNQAGLALLPKNVRNNPMVYPDDHVLKRAYIQRDVPDSVLRVYNQYWQQLKLTL